MVKEEGGAQRKKDLRNGWNSSETWAAQTAKPAPAYAPSRNLTRVDRAAGQRPSDVATPVNQVT